MYLRKNFLPCSALIRLKYNVEEEDKENYLFVLYNSSHIS